MTKEEFFSAVDKLYGAVRKAYGYGNSADKLIDNLEEMADAWEDKYEGENIKIGE